MTNRSKNRGTAWETAVVKYLRENGFPGAERRALSGSNDKGDITVCPGIIAECKDWADYGDGDVADWWKQTATERKNANAAIGLLVVKRAYRPTGMAWCWMQDGWGYWSAYMLQDALAHLRDNGYGNRMERDGV